MPTLIDHKMLRLSMGLLAIALPVVLVVFGFILCECIEFQDSISEYYSLRTRDVLVGILLAVGVFLFAYKGYPRKASDHGLPFNDDFFGHLACGFAIGVAYFPYNGDGWESVVHFVSAGGMFVVLAYFSLFLFTKSRAGGTKTSQKKKRNKIFVGSGLIMVACIVLMLVNWALGDTLSDIKPLLILEWIAIWAFGFSWIVKGGFLFRDPDSTSTEILAMFELTGATSSKYDETIRRLTEIGERVPDGQMYHICYGDKQSLQVIDVFESEAKLEAFGATLMPILQDIGGIETKSTVFEVYNIIEGQ